jgi:hypothetical protein
MDLNGTQIEEIVDAMKQKIGLYDEDPDKMCVHLQTAHC